MSLQTEARILSARNRWSGRIAHIRTGAVMAEVSLDCGGQEVVAVITRESAEQLGLREGETVAAIVKATDVMIGR